MLDNSPLKIGAVCVFGGTLAGNINEIEQVALEFGKSLATRQIKLVYGGGGTGIMGAVAKSVIESGGEVVGIIPRSMDGHDDNFSELPNLIVSGSMHERKLKMYSLADAFIAMPGGLGTLEETVEILSWLNLGIVREKPLFLVNSAFWEPFLKNLNHMVESGFLNQAIFKLFHVIEKPSEFFNLLQGKFVETSKHEDTNLSLKINYNEMEATYLFSPSYICAYELQRQASMHGFDWTDELQALEKCKEEFNELIEEIVSRERSMDRLLEEFGDLLFALFNLARHVALDPELAINNANRKFRKRFYKMIELIEYADSNIRNLTFDKILAYWNEAKQVA